MSLAVHTPDSVAGVLAALDEGAVVIAGGTHVMPRLNTHASPGVTALVSLRRAGHLEGTVPLMRDCPRFV